MMPLFERIPAEACFLSEKEIKGANFLPVDTGYMRDSAIYSEPAPNGGRMITFDVFKAPYINYLEYGTMPHDIPKAFGYALPFGIGGRFSGFFHPGSKKDVGFIEKSAELALKCALRTARRYGKVISYD